MADEPPRPLTKRELRTLKNALGKQGITMEEHEAAQKLVEPAKIVRLDCFALREREGQDPVENLPDEEGWHVGYGVAMNGVGRAGGGGEEFSDDSDEEEEEDSEEGEENGESSGFESDPPTDEEEIVEVRQERRESDDVSDKGQLLYGVDHQFYLHKTLPPKNCDVHYIREPTGNDNVNVNANVNANANENVNANANPNANEDALDVEIQIQDVLIEEIQNRPEPERIVISESFTTGKFVTTMRYPVASSTENTANTDDESHNGYQMIGDGSIPCVTSHSEDESEDDDNLDLEDVTTSAGLWCNFVISPEGFEGFKKEKIPEEKLKTIPLDAEKLAQISAAMAGLQLPTPPGWEGVSDEKLLEFINRRV